MTLGVSSELGYGQTDASQWRGDIISNQLQSGARRDFPVSGNPSKEFNFLMKFEENQATNAPRILVTLSLITHLVGYVLTKVQ